MKIRTSVLAQLGLFIASLLYSLYMSSRLPDVVPTHWGLTGKPDAYGPKWVNLFLMPGVILFMVLLTLVLPRISPRRFLIQPFAETYGYVMLLVSGLMVTLHVIIVQASTGHPLDMTKAITFVLYAFFALLGNVMGKIKRNFFMGIRTPWTLADERVWHATHRYAGRLWLVGGTLGAFGALLGVPFLWEMIYLMALAFLPVIKSYLIYVKLGPSG
jgi:uncharacterized membrane protein